VSEGVYRDRERGGLCRWESVQFLTVQFDLVKRKIDWRPWDPLEIHCRSINSLSKRKIKRDGSGLEN
jgi:hypothetical protein